MRETLPEAARRWRAPATQHLVWLAVLPGWLLACESGTSASERLLERAARAEPRPVEGRLSHSKRHSPWQVKPARNAQSPLNFETGSTAVLRGGAHEKAEANAEDLHRRGLLLVYRGSFATAAHLLEDAVEVNPSPQLLSDLAATYLAAAESDQPTLLMDALSAAAQARATAPQDPAVAFNHALALERAALRHLARHAWEEYLVLPDGEAWKLEASDRLAKLRQPTAADLWPEARRQMLSLAATEDSTGLDGLVRRFPRQSKELVELELLPGWAQAVGSPAARSELNLARNVAQALATTGDRFHSEVVAAIERASNQAPGLAQGVLLYSQAEKRRTNCSQAEPQFSQAASLLATVGNPLRWAARLGELVCLYRRDPHSARDLLANLAADLEEESYSALVARTGAMRGLTEVAAGRYSRAIPHYLAAIERLVAVADSDAIRVRGMLAEAYEFLGDRPAAWHHRLESLRGAVEAGDTKAVHGILAGLARQLVEAGRDKAAETVLGEMRVNAQSWPEPSAEAETLLRLIQLHLANGEPQRAGAEIAACSRLVGRFQQPADRERLKTELMLVSGEQQLATDPEAAGATLEATVKRFEERRERLLSPRALLDLSTARLARHDLAGAEEAFRQGVSIYEELRAEVESENHRITLFAAAQRSFDAMIRFQALDRGDAEAAFLYAEQARSRGLRDRASFSNFTEPARPLAEQLSRIPSDTAVLAFAVLPEELLAWRLTRSSLVLHVLPVPRRWVAERVDTLRAALSRASSPAEISSAAGEAFKSLLRPIIAGLPAETKLVFLPDRELNRLPFAALYDASRGRFLVEDFPSLVSPSLEHYLSSLDRRPVVGRPERVLAVGDPAFDTVIYPDLPRLPAAHEEALGIARLYPDSVALVGEEASRERILAELPGRQVLQLAAHVLVDPREPLRSALVTAGQGSPTLSATDLDAADLSAMELVFLSGCATAPGFPYGDREGVAGLARAVLAAGVPSVVATLWAVNDEATSRLAREFHVHYAQCVPAEEALRRAQLALLVDSSSSRPFAWAPFQLFRGP